MYEVSAEYLEAVRGDRRVFPTRIKFDGIDEYFTNKNLRNGSYTNTIDGNSVLSMGNACANKIEFTISNYYKPYVWKGSRFTVEKGLWVNGETVWVPWGTFWVTDIRTSNNKKTIDITGYDFMYQLSKRKYTTSLVAPFHYRDLLDEFLRLSGLTLSTEFELPEADDDDYVILSWPDGEYTFSDIAGHLAGMVCANARITWADPSVIEFTWWTATATKIHKETRMNGFEKLADSPLCVNYLVTGSNKEIVVENTGAGNYGEIDFSQFDVPSAEDLPLLTFTYDAETKTAAVSLADKSWTEPIYIPTRVLCGGTVCTVTSVPDYGFQYSSATEINLPQTVTSIGIWAFSGCKNLTRLRLSNSLTSLPTRGFNGCTALQSVEIPASVTSMGWSVFAGCTSLTSVVWNPIAMSAAGDVSGPPFNGCTALRSVTFADGVQIIPSNLFNNTGLVSIVIPDSVTTINSRAFANCKNLESVQIGESAACAITSIARSYPPFNGCTALQTITLFATVDSIAGSPWGASNATVSWML